MFNENTNKRLYTGRFPLYSKGSERVRFEYAVFLLNKNIEQLLNYLGRPVRNLRNTLPNLKLVCDTVGSAIVDEIDRDMDPRIIDWTSVGILTSQREMDAFTAPSEIEDFLSAGTSPDRTRPKPKPGSNSKIAATSKSVISSSAASRTKTLHDKKASVVSASPPKIQHERQSSGFSFLSQFLTYGRSADDAGDPTEHHPQ